MQIINTPLHHCFVLKPTLHTDERGFFYESFNQQQFEQATAKPIQFVQDNQALSHYGTLRGLHFQQGEHAQAKLVSVLQGSVLDVVVDMRPSSPTYLQHFSIELSAQNHLQLFVPRGFAHGYAVLENHTLFFYKCDNYYHKASESGILYNDPTLNINWKLPPQHIILSAKDKLLPALVSE